MFLNLLPINSRLQDKIDEEHSEFHINETLYKEGEYIISGIMVKG